MRHLDMRSILISFMIGLVAIIAGHLLTHIIFDTEISPSMERLEVGVAVLVLIALVVVFKSMRSNEKRLRSANQELTRLSEERAAVLDKLRVSQASLAKAQRIARLGNWDWNIQTGDLTWSDEIYRIFGLMPQEFGATYEAFLNSVYPDDRDAVIEAVNKAVYEKHPYAIEHRVQWPDGTVRFVHEQGEVEYNDEGEPLAMSGTVLDITERKKREDEIKVLNAQLENRVEERTAKLLDEVAVRKAAERESRREREKAERYLSMAGNMLVALDHKGRIEMINAKGAETLGYDNENDLIGKDWFDVALPKNERVVVRNVFDEIIAGHLEAFAEFENEIITRSGDVRMMRWHNAVLRDDTGRITGTLGSATDITEQKLHEEHLLRAKEAAEEASRSKSGFLSNMSHELRTPMNAILGFCQLIQTDSKNLNEQQNEYLDIIHNSGKHLLTLINEILDLSRMEIGALKVEQEDLLPSEAIRGTLSLMKPLAQKHHISLLPTPDLEDVPMVVADAARLHQVLVNLMSNAIKYNQPGGKAYITTENATPGMLRICVHDTGPGIPANRRHELFQPFNRLDAENSGIEGAGVGLVLTKNLIELMNGRIGFDSRQGQGSTFWIELPLSTEENSASGHISQKTPHVPAKSHHRILCIEDNPTDLRLFQDIVSHLENVELIPAPTIEDGAMLAETHAPDLVVVTVDLPCDGETSLMTWCKSQSPQVPMMAVCECQGVRELENCQMQEYAICIDKPIDVDEVLTALRDNLHLPPPEDGKVVQLKPN